MRRFNGNERWIALMLAALVTSCDYFSREDRTPPGAYQGIVEFDEHVLSFDLGGRLTSVRVEPGARVQEGDLIATLDDTLATARRAAVRHEAEAAELQVSLLRAGERNSKIRSMVAEIRAARTAEAQLKANLEREKRLLQRGVSTDERIDNLRFQLDKASAHRQALVQKLQVMREGARGEEIASAEARSKALATQVDVQEEQIRRHRLEAAATGDVLEVHVKTGEVVAPGSPVAIIADTRRPYADVFVPQAETAGIQVNSPAAIHVDSLAEPLSGKVEHVARRTEFTPRFIFSEKDRFALVVRVRVRIDDPQGSLQAGLPAFVTFQSPAGD